MAQGSFFRERKYLKKERSAENLQHIGSLLLFRNACLPRCSRFFPSPRLCCGNVISHSCIIFHAAYIQPQRNLQHLLLRLLARHARPQTTPVDTTQLLGGLRSSKERLSTGLYTYVSQSSGRPLLTVMFKRYGSKIRILRRPLPTPSSRSSRNRV
jgi:hypothetical protein